MAAARARLPRRRRRAGAGQAEALCDSCSRQKPKTTEAQVRPPRTVASNRAATGTHRQSYPERPYSSEIKEKLFSLNSPEGRRHASASQLNFLTIRRSLIKQ